MPRPWCTWCACRLYQRDPNSVFIQAYAIPPTLVQQTKYINNKLNTQKNNIQTPICVSLWVCVRCGTTLNYPLFPLCLCGARVCNCHPSINVTTNPLFHIQTIFSLWLYICHCVCYCDCWCFTWLMVILTSLTLLSLRIILLLPPSLLLLLLDHTITVPTMIMNYNFNNIPFTINDILIVDTR